MKVVTLDIETIPDLSRWQPPPDSPDVFPPVPYHIPVVVAWLVVDSTTGKLELQVYSRQKENEDGHERLFLDVLGTELRAARRVVTWNGRGFDMPLLNLRALKHGADWSFWRGMLHRYGNYKQALVHHDLMDLLGDQGGVRNMPLKGVAGLLGLDPKGDISGAEVKDVWPKDPDRVIRYCKSDVLTTYLVYLRWCEVFERAPVDGMRDRVLELAEKVCAGAMIDKMEEW